MGIRKKSLWLALAFLVVAGAAAGWWWWASEHQAAPQIITLPNGDQYRFAGVTYGRRNVPPSFMPRLVSRLPAGLVNLAQKYAGNRMSRYTQFNAGNEFDSPRLFVWFQSVGSNSTSAATTLKAILADEKGVEAGGQSYATFFGSMGWDYAEFPVMPRRSRVLRCDFYNFSVNGSLIGKISFRNPYYGRYPQWQPESLPAVKTVGDLEVRLEHFDTGVQTSGRLPVLADGHPGIGYRPATNGDNAETFFDITLRPTQGTNQAWVVQAAEICDATGNVLANPSNTSSGGRGTSPMIFLGEYRLPIPGALWPDESAWRLKVHVKLKSGFPPEDLVTFTNVPVPKLGTTNLTPIATMVGGVKLVLVKFLRNPARVKSNFVNRTPETEVRVELPGKSEGVAVDLVRMSTDVGEQIPITGNGWEPADRIVWLGFIPTNAQTVNMTWALQKMRSVEFLVKPPKQE